MLNAAAALLLLSSTVFAATAEDWKSRSVYQVLTDRFALTDGSTEATCTPSDEKYCGGTWQGIINKLDYIQNMGFTAVWISPITKQVDIPSSYHGYYQTDLYSVNEGYGSEEDLKALSDELHKRDMYLMVDVVPNHFASPGPVENIDYAAYVPFNSSEYFHPFCLIQDSDYDGNQTAVEQVCLNFFSSFLLTSWG